MLGGDEAFVPEVNDVSCVSMCNPVEARNWCSANRQQQLPSAAQLLDSTVCEGRKG